MRGTITPGKVSDDAGTHRDHEIKIRDQCRRVGKNSCEVRTGWAPQIAGRAAAFITICGLPTIVCAMMMVPSPKLICSLSRRPHIPRTVIEIDAARPFSGGKR
jgi:hypothetical protein